MKRVYFSEKVLEEARKAAREEGFDLDAMFKDNKIKLEFKQLLDQGKSPREAIKELIRKRKSKRYALIAALQQSDAESSEELEEPSV